METKRTVNVDLCGQRLTVRTTEPEADIERNIARVQGILDEIQARAETVDTVRLFALGLLHLGRELNMMEASYTDLCRDVETRLDAWSQRVHQSLHQD